MAQSIGIGTSNPASSAVLDITSANKGLLISRVALTATNNKIPLTGNIPNGTLVYNTANSGAGNLAVSPGIYQWYNGGWYYPAELGSAVAKAVKYNNSTSRCSDNNDNFNSASISSPNTIEIFGEQIFNDDTGIFEKVSDSKLKLKQAGLYLVSLSLALRQDPQQENSQVYDYIYFNLNNILASPSIAAKTPQADPSEVNINGKFAFVMNTYIIATAGQILTLQSKRWKDGSNYDGTINFDPNSLSSVTIVKLK